MSEWKEYKLGDLYNVSSGLSKVADQFGFGYTFISFKDVFWNYFIPENPEGLVNSNEKEKATCNVSKGDILITRTSESLEEVGMTAVALKDYPNSTFNGFSKRLRLKKNAPIEISPLFMGYLLRTRFFRKSVANYATMTTRASLNGESIKSIPLDFPPIEIQREIGKTLHNLEKKVELLKSQNQTLEELAQTLFKRWFVEFEFPNENGQPYKSSGGKMVESELGEIPEGWELHPLEDLVKVHNGYSYKGSELQESNVAMVTLKNFDRNGGFRFDGFKELVSDRYKEKHVVDVGDLIVAHTDLTQDAEVLGNPALIMKNEKYTKLVVSMDLVKVESKHKSLNTEFLYYLMRDKRFKYHCKGYANGTTVLHLSKSAIPEYLFPFPKDMTLIEEFGAYAYSVYQKISNNIEEIQSLTQLRDTLLPKSMSRELRVKE